jgi:hypothetical protein
MGYNQVKKTVEGFQLQLVVAPGRAKIAAPTHCHSSQYQSHLGWA